MADKIKQIELVKTGSVTIRAHITNNSSANIQFYYSIRDSNSITQKGTSVPLQVGKSITYDQNFFDLSIGTAAVSIKRVVYNTTSVVNTTVDIKSGGNGIIDIGTYTVNSDPPNPEGPWYEGMENLTPSEDTLVMDVPETEQLNEDL